MSKVVPVGGVLRARREGGAVELTFVAMAIIVPAEDYGTMLVLRVRAQEEGGDVTVLDGQMVRP